MLQSSLNLNRGIDYIPRTGRFRRFSSWYTGIPITNLSVNPARSTGPAIFAGGHMLGGQSDGKLA